LSAKSERLFALTVVAIRTSLRCGRSVVGDTDERRFCSIYRAIIYAERKFV